jgi:hypothetical protein
MAGCYCWWNHWWMGISAFGAADHGGVSAYFFIYLVAGGIFPPSPVWLECVKTFMANGVPLPDYSPYSRRRLFLCGSSRMTFTVYPQVRSVCSSVCRPRGVL